MTNYMQGDSVSIHGCNYEVKDYYLSAKSNGSYPKVLAKILGIADMNEFVSKVLGYSNFGDKVFGFDGMEDGNKLIDALKNFSGVAPKTSGILKTASIKKFFDNDMNLERLERVGTDASKLLNNFSNIRAITANIIAKVSEKNNELVNAIDSQDVANITRLEKEFVIINEYITDTNDVLTILNKMGEQAIDEVEDFNAEEFITGKKD